MVPEGTPAVQFLTSAELVLAAGLALACTRRVHSGWTLWPLVLHRVGSVKSCLHYEAGISISTFRNVLLMNYLFAHVRFSYIPVLSCVVCRHLWEWKRGKLGFFSDQPMHFSHRWEDKGKKGLWCLFISWVVKTDFFFFLPDFNSLNK